MNLDGNKSRTIYYSTSSLSFKQDTHTYPVNSLPTPVYVRPNRNVFFCQKTQDDEEKCYPNIWKQQTASTLVQYCTVNGFNVKNKMHSSEVNNLMGEQLPYSAKLLINGQEKNVIFQTGDRFYENTRLNKIRLKKYGQTNANSELFEKRNQSEKTTYCRPVEEYYNQEYFNRTRQNNKRLQSLVKKLVKAREKEKQKAVWDDYINKLKIKHGAIYPTTLKALYASNKQVNADVLKKNCNVRFDETQSKNCENLIHDMYSHYNVVNILSPQFHKQVNENTENNQQFEIENNHYSNTNANDSNIINAEKNYHLPCFHKYDPCLGSSSTAGTKNKSQCSYTICTCMKQIPQICCDQDIAARGRLCPRLASQANEVRDTLPDSHLGTRSCGNRNVIIRRKLKPCSACKYSCLAPRSTRPKKNCKNCEISGSTDCETSQQRSEIPQGIEQNKEINESPTNNIKRKKKESFLKNIAPKNNLKENNESPSSNIKRKKKESLLKNIEPKNGFKENLLKNIEPKNGLKENLLKNIEPKNGLKENLLKNIEPKNGLKENLLKNVEPKKSFHGNSLKSIELKNSFNEGSLKNIENKLDMLIARDNKLKQMEKEENYQNVNGNLFKNMESKLDTLITQMTVLLAKSDSLSTKHIEGSKYRQTDGQTDSTNLRSVTTSGPRFLDSFTLPWGVRCECKNVIKESHSTAMIENQVESREMMTMNYLDNDQTKETNTDGVGRCCRYKKDHNVQKNIQICCKFNHKSDGTNTSNTETSLSSAAKRTSGRQPIQSNQTNPTTTRRNLPNTYSVTVDTSWSNENIQNNETSKKLSKESSPIWKSSVANLTFTFEDKHTSTCKGKYASANTLTFNEILQEEKDKSDQAKQAIEDILYRGLKKPDGIENYFDVPTKECSTEVTRSLSKAGVGDSSSAETSSLVLYNNTPTKTIAMAINTDPLSLLALLQISTATITQLLSNVYFNYHTILSLPMPRPLANYFNCSVCDSTFRGVTEFSEHIRNHTLHPAKKCCVCHRITRRNDNRYSKCRHCGKNFPSGYLELHERNCTQHVLEVREQHTSDGREEQHASDNREQHDSDNLLQLC